METLPKLPPKGELHLNYLDVSHCKIRELPEGFNRLHCLATLDISHNRVSADKQASQHQSESLLHVILTDKPKISNIPIIQGVCYY